MFLSLSRSYELSRYTMYYCYFPHRSFALPRRDFCDPRRKFMIREFSRRTFNAQRGRYWGVLYSTKKFSSLSSLALIHENIKFTTVSPRKIENLMSRGPNKSEGWRFFWKKAGRDAYSGLKSMLVTCSISNGKANE